MSDGRAAARAVDALRRGWPVEVAAADGALLLLPVETADAGRLAAFAPAGAGLLLSAGRALTLKLANQAAASDPERPVRIASAPWLDFDLGMAAADPQLDLATPIKGPLRAVAEPGTEAAAAAALRLARIAGLLPAFFTGGAGAAEARVTAGDIAALEDPERLVIATRARLPVAAADSGQLVVFRTGDGGDEHVALVIGTPDGTPPLVRLHSECLTGDVFGSLRCDCGPQLNGALGRIRDAGWGILLYLRQEGRGIGLVNKLRAYRLQDQGHDTFEANHRLGLAAEARDFRVAARMLTLLGQRRVRLLTNNPAKVAALLAAGIDVAERVPLAIAANPHNAAYLDAKRDQSGHQL